MTGYSDWRAAAERFVTKNNFSPDTVDGIANLIQDEVTRVVIEIEKLMCAALDRPWSASGISVETLISDLHAQRKASAVSEPVTSNNGSVAEPPNSGRVTPEQQE